MDIGFVSCRLEFQVIQLNCPSQTFGNGTMAVCGESKAFKQADMQALAPFTALDLGLGVDYWIGLTIALHCTALHYTALHCTTLHCCTTISEPHIHCTTTSALGFSLLTLRHAAVLCHSLPSLRDSCCISCMERLTTVSQCCTRSEAECSPGLRPSQGRCQVAETSHQGASTATPSTM
jgi:hypothetical protein